MNDWQVAGYVEEDELGRGGGGRVVVAVDQASGERVAVKYLAGRLVADEEFRAAFRQEAEILARLDLPHVARVRRYVESGAGAAIVMDLVRGVSLRRILSESGPAGPRAALSVLKGSLMGLAGAHRAGIVHRDYKPENVIVDNDGNSMLVDFGIAARTGTAGRPAGTPGYAAPEQWAGAPASPSGDIYAAAITFAECIIRGESIGPRLSGLIERATAADPAVRPADADALLDELQHDADERYGAGWEDEGRADLARAVAALLVVGAAGAAAGGAVAASAAGGPAAAAPAAQGPAAPAVQGPAATAATTFAQTRRLRRAGQSLRAGGGHGVLIAAAAGVVVAGTAVAVAVTSHHGHNGPGRAGRPGQPGTSASGSASPGRGRSTAPASPAPTGSVLAVNAANPCTWLTPADFGKYGITTGPLRSYSLPTSWLGCRNGSVIVGRRDPARASAGCSFLPHCTLVSVPGAAGGRILVVGGQGIEIDAFRGGIEYAVAVPAGTANARAALLQLMELVLTRTAAA